VLPIVLDPEVVSTSLGHIAHILVLTSQYLAIRLPATVTLPQRDHPRPTIFSLASSYRYGDGLVVASGSGVAASSAMANVGKVQARNGRQPSVVSQTLLPQSAGNPQYHPAGGRTPRARPLFLDKPVCTLARDDPTAFGFFVEGVTLLAYDIAWACATQGILVVCSESSLFEDMFDLGRNLWMLLLSDPRRTSPQDKKITNGHPPVSAPSNTSNTNMTQGGTKPPLRFSHGTADAFLGTSEGHEHIRSFRLPAPMTLADELRRRVLNECVTDWEVVNDDFDDGDDVTDAMTVMGHDGITGAETLTNIDTSTDIDREGK